MFPCNLALQKVHLKFKHEERAGMQGKEALPKDTWQKSQCFGVLLCFDVSKDICEALLPQTVLPAQALSHLAGRQIHKT